MKVFVDCLLLIVGFILLIKGAGWFVDGSASVAKRLRIPTLIIGMTIVAMGTSAPECAVSIAAAIKGSNTMAISNVLGSNIFNLMVVCGACALFKPLVVKTSTLKMELPLSILAGVLLLVLGYLGMSLGRLDGVVFLVLFGAFLVWMVFSARKSRDGQPGDTTALDKSGKAGVTAAEATAVDEKEEIKIMPVWKCVVCIAAGLICIVLGGDIVVDSASSIATQFGLSQTLIGLTIVACGTSLPELVTSLVAARKGEADMALGNVIGSNIFNILLVLGIAALVSPMAVLMDNLIDAVLLALMSLITWFFAWRSRSISRLEGSLMLVLYVSYVFYICLR